jgi:hypothetical protein
VNNKSRRRANKQQSNAQGRVPFLVALPRCFLSRCHAVAIFDVGRRAVFDQPLEESGIEFLLDSVVERGLACLRILVVDVRASQRKELGRFEFFQFQQERNGVIPTMMSTVAPARINRSRIPISSYQPAAYSPPPGARVGFAPRLISSLDQLSTLTIGDAEQRGLGIQQFPGRFQIQVLNGLENARLGHAFTDCMIAIG